MIVFSIAMHIYTSNYVYRWESFYILWNKKHKIYIVNASFLVAWWCIMVQPLGIQICGYILIIQVQIECNCDYCHDYKN